MVSLAHLSDNELLLLLKRGNDFAFSEIYNRYWGKMVSYAVRLTKSEDESADLVQEIFVSLWNRKETLEIKGTLASYLIKSTRNLCLRFIERNIHPTDFINRLAEHTIDKSQNIEENISLKELQEHIYCCVAKLPKKMQEVYLLSRDEQLSYREIAKKLGITEGTVKKQISNSLKIISESLNGKVSVLIPIIFVHLLKII